MKKLLLFLLVAFSLSSCGQFGQENGEDENGSGIPLSDIVFDFTVNYPGETKAVKSGWETGDAVFVFFQSYSGFYVVLTYNASSGWSSSVGPENAVIPVNFSSENKTVTAIYRPFGSRYDTPKYSSSDGWFFHSNFLDDETTQYTYFMAAQKASYTFEQDASGQWVLTATLNMKNPDGYVQFFVEDASASSGDYLLSTDAVIPTGFAAVAPDGTIVETSDKKAGDDMVGYAYGSGTAKGYLFSGKLNSSYHSYRWNGSEMLEANAYYFAKTKTAENSRADYFVTGKTLASHSAIKLPANGNAKWQAVGSGIYYELDNVPGTWCTCNYRASVPEEIGSLLKFNPANNEGLPTKDHYQALIDNCEWTWLSVNGHAGMAVKAASGFLFLPARGGWYGEYWSSTESGDSNGYFLNFDTYVFHDIRECDRSTNLAVRPFQN